MKNIIEDLKNKVYKPIIGYIHIRFPGTPKPHELFLDREGNAATQETDWVKLDDYYPGCFFRMSGDNASKFKEDNSTITEYEENVKGLSGGQIDTLQEHQHDYYQKFGWDRVTDFNNDDWCLDYDEDVHRYTTKNTGRISPETRPKNITVEIYKYEP